MQIDVHQLELLLQVLFMCLLSCFIFLLVTENKSLRMVFILLFSVVNKSSLACIHCIMIVVVHNDILDWIDYPLTLYDVLVVASYKVVSYAFQFSL